MGFKALTVLSFLVIVGYHVSHAETFHGPCKNANIGQKFTKCEVQCNLDGSCTETVSSEVCCSRTNDFHNSFSRLAKGFKNGQRVSRKKRQVGDVCARLPTRCSDCNGGFGKRAQAQARESFNCSN
jgi:hypothetical protein